MPGLVTEGLGESPGGGGGFQITNVAVAANKLTITFSSPATDLTGPSAVISEWKVTVDDGISQPVTITAVNIVAGKIELTTTDMTGGGVYLLWIPLGIMSSGQAMLGPFVEGFTGVATIPALLFARSSDAHVVDVVFTSPPVEVDALNVSNWHVSPVIQVLVVIKITDKNYQLRTSTQAIGVSYTLTWP
jgi:hypothetical protein